MKFGKNLQQIIEASSPTWAKFWMNYKGLKKLVKDLPKRRDDSNANGTTESEEPPKAPAVPERKAVLALAAAPQEVVFFTSLKDELEKVSSFFAKEEESVFQEVEAFVTEYQDLKNTLSSDTETHTRLMALCVERYKQLLLLENFAVMNYCGFSKILKKHDRWTGYGTREKYMARKVNHQEFTEYPRLQQMIQRAENIFNELAVVASESKEELSSTVVSSPTAKSKPGNSADYTLHDIQRLHTTSKSIQKDEIDVHGKQPPLADEENVSGASLDASSRRSSPQRNVAKKRKLEDVASEGGDSDPDARPRSPKISLRSILN